MDITGVYLVYYALLSVWYFYSENKILKKEKKQAYLVRNMDELIKHEIEELTNKANECNSCEFDISKCKDFTEIFKNAKI